MWLLSQGLRAAHGLPFCKAFRKAVDTTSSRFRLVIGSLVPAAMNNGSSLKCVYSFISFRLARLARLVCLARLAITLKLMCTNSRRIFTNARYLSNVCRYTLTVPCGKCEECKNQIRSHYLVRSYYESLKVAKRHGVCLFDTLTYKPEDVPEKYGIKCFNYEDLVLFKKRLKINISRDGYDSKQISYFISSEYGDHTARPHYHILLFAWFKGATAHYLHSVVSRSWPYGFTDKMVKQVVLSNNGVGALSYVTKYVAKSLGDTQQLEIALKQGVKNLTEEQVKDLFENYKECFKIKHFQSIGYGDYLLELMATNQKLFNVDVKKEFFENSRVVMPDKKNYYKFYPLGHFYIYRVFFDRVYNPVTQKCDQYKLNEIGKEWKILSLLQARDKLMQRFNEYKPQIIANLTNEINSGTCENPLWKSLRYHLINDEIDVKGFAEYVLFYRNLSWLNSQYCPFEMWSFEHDIENDLNALGSIENHCYSKKFVSGYDDLGNPIIEDKPYSKEFRNRLLSRRYDLLTTYEPDKLFELLFILYSLVDANDKVKREDIAREKAQARDTLHLAQLVSEEIQTR